MPHSESGIDRTTLHYTTTPVVIVFGATSASCMDDVEHDRFGVRVFTPQHVQSFRKWSPAQWLTPRRGRRWRHASRMHVPPLEPFASADHPTLNYCRFLESAGNGGLVDCQTFVLQRSRFKKKTRLCNVLARKRAPGLRDTWLEHKACLRNGGKKYTSGNNFWSD